MTMLGQRVVTAVVLLAVLLPTLFAPVVWPFAAVTLVCALATAIPLRVGLRRMEEYEF